MRKVFLSVSGLALTACSMSGGGYADHNNSNVNQYGPMGHASYQGCQSQTIQSPCGTSVYKPRPPVSPCATKACAPAVYHPKPVAPKPCAPRNPCSTANLRHSYGGSYYGGPSGHGAKSGYSYPVAHTPSPHAYGTHAGGQYSGQSYGGAPTQSVWDGPHFYGSLGAVMYDIEDSAFGVQSRFGYQFHPIVGAELEGSIGLLDDTETVTYTDPTDPMNVITGEADAGIDYSVAAFATARMPVADRISAHGRVGYHVSEAQVSLEDSGVKVSVSGEFDGLAYGGGLEYEVSNTDSIRIDYTRYEAEVGGLDSVSVGYLRRF